MSQPKSLRFLIKAHRSVVQITQVFITAETQEEAERKWKERETDDAFGAQWETTGDSGSGSFTIETVEK